MRRDMTLDLGWFNEISHKQTMKRNEIYSNVKSSSIHIFLRVIYFKTRFYCMNDLFEIMAKRLLGNSLNNKLDDNLNFDKNAEINERVTLLLPKQVDFRIRIFPLGKSCFTQV